MRNRPRVPDLNERAIPSFQREFIIEHESGLHARPAVLFVRTAQRFASKVRLANLSLGLAEVNGKSLLEVLTAGVERGHHIRITAIGDDAQAALGALGGLIEGNFKTIPLEADH